MLLLGKFPAQDEAEDDLMLHFCSITTLIEIYFEEYVHTYTHTTHIYIYIRSVTFVYSDNRLKNRKCLAVGTRLLYCKMHDSF